MVVNTDLFLLLTKNRNDSTCSSTKGHEDNIKETTISYAKNPNVVVNLLKLIHPPP